MLLEVAKMRNLEIVRYIYIIYHINSSNILYIEGHHLYTRSTLIIPNYAAKVAYIPYLDLVVQAFPDYTFSQVHAYHP